MAAAATAATAATAAAVLVVVAIESRVRIDNENHGNQDSHTYNETDKT